MSDSSISDETRGRTVILLTFLLFAAFLLMLLLYPEFVILHRYQYANCTVLSKTPPRLHESQARIVNNVTVNGLDGHLRTFIGTACNPIDCDINGSPFMDRQHWVNRYHVGETYHCLYDTKRDHGGFQWVVFDPVIYSVTLWLLLIGSLGASVGGCVYSVFQHVKEKGLPTHVVKRWLVAAWRAVKGCLVSQAKALHCKAVAIWPWSRANRQSVELEGLHGAESTNSLPPSYDGRPPSYEHFAIDDEFPENESAMSTSTTETEPQTATPSTQHSPTPTTTTTRRGYEQLATCDDD